jgi:hypothetical protein
MLPASRTVRQGAVGPADYPGLVRQLAWTLGALAALVAGARLAVVVRRWRAERAPRRELNGKGPVIGSFDTWPPVPRAPSGTSTAP